VKSARRQPAGVELADQLEKEIRSGKHHAGEVLGFESELITRHGAGRAVVRQAVRILEQRGIAYSRRGKGGGLVVTAPKPDSAIRALSIVIGSQFADFTDISALISASDNHQFLNCTERADPAACRQLQLLVEKFETLSARASDTRFRRCISGPRSIACPAHGERLRYRSDSVRNEHGRGPISRPILGTHAAAR
jgi:DNA-binding FadR family transcriptional regulator